MATNNAELVRQAQEAKEKQANTTQIVIESMSLFSSKEAVAFYKAQCDEFDVKPNNTFLRQLMNGEELSVLNFSNSYFGDRGMTAIAPVLGKVPVIALDLRNTGFSATDAQALSHAMLRHPTLTSLDLRGNTLSVPTTRRLLSLLVQNKRITACTLNEDAPKRALIEQQCINNSDVVMYASCCLVCLRTVSYDEALYAESHLITRLWERLGPRALSLAAVELEVICRAILACVDLNDGVLLLCGHECIESIVDDLLIACNIVTHVSRTVRGASRPRHEAINRIATVVLAEVNASARQRDAEASRATETAAEETEQQMVNSPSGGTETARLLVQERVTKLVESHARDHHHHAANAQREGDETWQACEICGTMCMVLRENTSALMLKMIYHDVTLMMQKRSQMRPSAFSRLLKRVLANVAPKLSSRKVLRAHVRFGIYGFGGVLRPLPASDEEHISAVIDTKAPLDDIDFGVIDFANAFHYDLPEEDTTCAQAVASMVADIEGARIDPYFTYASAKFLSGSKTGHFGLDLRKALESACTFGCLPADVAPYAPRSPRSQWADWERCWTSRPDFALLRKHALSRRKARFYAIHKPGGNLFDEMRAVLWSTRGLRRGLVGALKWRTEWFAARGGVIPTEKFSGGFYVAAKILGQCRLEDGDIRLIIQPTFGAAAGRNGFFFASRTVINRGFKFGAFALLEPESIQALNGVATFASKSARVLSAVPSNVRRLMRARNELFALFEFLAETRRVPRSTLQSIEPLFSELPVGLSFGVFVADGPSVIPEHRRQLEYLRSLFAVDAGAQLAFTFTSAIGEYATAYFAAHLSDAKRLKLLAESTEPSLLVETVQRSESDLGPSRAASSRGPALLAGREFEVSVRPPPSGLSDALTNQPVMAPQAPTPPPKKGALAAPPRPGAGGAHKKGGAKQTGAPLVDAAAQQAHQDLMREVAAQVERERSRAKELNAQSRRRTMNAWSPPEHLIAAASPSVGSPSVSVEAVANSSIEAVCNRTSNQLGFNALAKDVFRGARTPWQAVRLPVGRQVLFFHGRCVTIIDPDAAADTVVLPPTPMQDTPAFAHFPFRNGFDAASVCAAVSPTILYVFTQGYWIQWDLARSSCIAGPFDIRTHATFKSLPPAYSAARGTPEAKLRAVLDVPGKPQLAFCTAHSYAVVDVTTNELVGEYSFGGINDIGAMRGLGCSEADHTPVASLPSCVVAAAESRTFGDSVDPSLSSESAALVVMPSGSVVDFASGAERGHLSGLNSVLPLELRVHTLEGIAALLQLMCAEVMSVLASVNLYVPSAWSERAPSEVAPAVLPGGLSTSTEVMVTSSFAPARSSVDLTDLIRGLSPSLAEIEDDGIIIDGSLDSLAVFCATAGAAATAAEADGLHAEPARVDGSISIDFGPAAHCRFGYLQLVLALDGNLSQAADVLVECSWDGIAYRSVTRFTVDSNVTDAHWGPTHGSRFWRLSFAGLPDNAKVVRTLWYTASWSVESRTFNTSVTYQPNQTHNVMVDAARTLCPPAAILRPINAASVVQINHAPSTYLPPHCTLPLLPPARSVLLIVGTSFVEWDVAANCLVAKETCSLVAHPGFQSLPFPFDHGIDAAFYPDPVHSRNVVLVRSGLVVEWNIDSGTQVGQPMPISQSPWLAGIPPPFCDTVDAIVNVWDRPGQIILFSGNQTMTWYVAELQIADPPVQRRSRPFVHAPSIDGTLSTALTHPSEPNQLILFQGTQYAVIDTTRDRHVTRIDEGDIVGSPRWPHLSWFIDWGVVREETAITFDFGADNPLFVGVTLHMALPSGKSTFEPSAWCIEAGEDGRAWQTVCDRHEQTAMTCSARWEMPTAGFRYYRLRLLSTNATQEQHLLQTRFHVPRTSNLNLPPVSWRTTGKLLGNGHDSPVAVQFVDKISADVPGVLIADFGELAAVELVSVNVTQRQPDDANKGELEVAEPTELLGALQVPCAVRWCVMYSDDGTNWRTVGRWRTRGGSTKLNWAPCLPHRFWRVDLEGCNVNGPTPVFEEFTFSEYSGIAACPPKGTEYTNALSILCPLAWRCGNTGVSLPGQAGSELLFDCKGTPQAFVGVNLAGEVASSAFTTRFSVEYSEDGQSWHAVTDVVVSRQVATAVWESEGAYRFWRLVIAAHYGAPTVRLVSVDWSDSGPALYMRQRRHVARVSPTTFRAKSRAQSEFVSVRAKIPGNTRWVVERAADSATEWIALSVLENLTSDARFLTTSWPLQGSSVFWRLRPLDDEVDASTATDVQWYSLCGVAAHPVATTPETRVSAQGFTWVPGTSPVQLSVGPASRSAVLIASDAAVPVDEAPPISALPPADGSSERLAILDYTFPRASRFTAVEFCVAEDRKRLHSLGDVVATVEQVDEDGSVVTRPLESMLLCDNVEVMSWGKAVARAARRWRIRFSIRNGAPFALSSVRWFFEFGAVAPVIERWLPAVSNELQRASHFYRDRSRSLAIENNLAAVVPVASAHFYSTLPKDELPPLSIHGELVLQCFDAQKQAQKRVTRALKARKRTGGSGSSSSNSDSAPIPVCDVLALYASTQADFVASLVGGVLMSEMKLAKDTQTWLLPKTEYRGSLASPTFGIAGCNASLALRWRIDSELSEPGSDAVESRTYGLTRHLSSLTVAAAGTGPILPPDWTAVTFTVDITNRDWVPASHFPGVAPVLIELGAPGRQLVVCVAGSRVDFTSDHPLTLPNSITAIAPYHPITLERGVNLIFDVKPATCPSLEVNLTALFNIIAPQEPEPEVEAADPEPEMDASVSMRKDGPGRRGRGTKNAAVTPPSTPRAKPPPAPAREHTLTAVLHMNDAQAAMGHVRFTSSAQTSLGFPRVLSMSTVRFEIDVDCDASHPHRRLSFASLEASVALGASATSFPASIIGNLTNNGARLQFDGEAPAARWVEPAGIPATLLDTIRFRGLSVAEGDSFAGTAMTVSGALRFLTENLTVPATAAVTGSGGDRKSADGRNAPTDVDTMQIELHQMTLAELMSLVRGLCNYEFPGSRDEWLTMPSIEVSGVLDVTLKGSSHEAFGTGSLRFGDSVGSASFTAGRGGVSISAAMPRLSVCNLDIRPASGTTVMLEFFAPPDGAPFARVDGLAALVTMEAVPCSVDISSDGVLVRTQGSFVDAFSRSATMSKPMTNATIVFPVDVFREAIAGKLRRSPLLGALCSAGVPFTFDLHAVEVKSADVQRSTFVIALHGVLLGASFSVNIPCTDLHLGHSFIEGVADKASLAIVEHSTDAVWPLVAEFVLGTESKLAGAGAAATNTALSDALHDVEVVAERAGSGDDAESGSESSGDSAALPSSPTVQYAQHSFLSRWSADAAEMLMEGAEAAVDIV